MADDTDRIFQHRQKHDDRDAGTLTVRARVEATWPSSRPATCLNWSEIQAHPGNDYRYRHCAEKKP